MGKPQEILPKSLIEEVQKMEPALDVGYTDNEEFIRAIYKNQSMPKLDLVNRLLSAINSVGLEKNGPTFLVGLYPSGKHLKVREETHIKEQFLMSLAKEGHIRNLYTRIAEVPDMEGPFTNDVMVADLQYSYTDLVKILNATKIDLEQKIRVRTGDKIKFENEILEFEDVQEPFKGGQGKIMELLFQNRREYIGTQVIIEGQSVPIKQLKDVGSYLKGDFRSALKQCRSKLKQFKKTRIKIEIKNTHRGKGLYQLNIYQEQYSIG